MKILSLTLSLYFSLFAACGIYAANTTVVSNYPSPSGSYNQIVITPQVGTTFCASASDVGQMYYNTSTNTLQLCAYVNGALTQILTSSETCFNRFCCVGGSCNTTCSASTNFTTGSPCPVGYTQAKSSGVDITDHFSNSGYTVYSTTCCSSGSPVLPT